MKDPRERRFVSKIDRYELEDKYLRLLDEVQSLKKLSNSQEDKIKKLATKLMRVSASPRSCVNFKDIFNDKDKISILESENDKLKSKVKVLRNQLLSHSSFGRSPYSCRKVTGTHSGATTCRSESMRPKTPSCHLLVQNGYDNTEVQKYLFKIQELEAQKEKMVTRMSELENELSSHVVVNQRKKIAENIEYIRVWRQMKGYSEKLVVVETEKDSLNEQVQHLKRLIEEKTRNNEEITASLMEERKRMGEMEDQMLKAKDSQLSVREKDERIRDLMNEMKILQQHNNELIALSSKYSQVEVENIELKKKISEQFSGHQMLKSAFSNEQANIVALQAANSQLLTKLQELQKNIDTLTVQLAAFQRKSEKQERGPKEFLNKSHKSRHLERKISSSSTSSQISEKSSADLANDHKKSCEIVARKSGRGQGVEKGSQTEDIHLQKPSKAQEKKEVAVQDSMSAPKRVSERIKSPKMNEKVKRVPNGNSLSPETMLKLLEQAQINTPFDMRNARIKQIEPVSESVQKQRQVMNLETLLFGDSSFF